MKDSLFYSNHSWTELKKAAEEGTVLILPVGSTEQHGPALPICTDDYMALRWAEDAAQKACDEYSIKVLVMPGIHYGYARHHMEFPGTITLSSETLQRVVYEVSDSALEHGFRKLVILNVHGGNRNAVRAAANDLAMKYARRTPVVRLRVVEDSDPDISPLLLDRDRLLQHSVEAASSHMVHGGALESSKMLHLRPDLVHLDKAADINISKKSGAGEIYPYDVLTPFGAMGRPSEATPKAGEIMWNALVRHFTDSLVNIYREA